MWVITDVIISWLKKQILQHRTVVKTATIKSKTIQAKDDPSQAQVRIKANNQRKHQAFSKPSLYLNSLALFVHCTNDYAIFSRRNYFLSNFAHAKKANITLFLQTLPQNKE